MPKGEKMKKKLLLTLAATVCSLSFALGLAACKPDGHTHSWASEYASNDTHHWHECTADGCTVQENADKNGYAAHSYDATSGMCVCGKRNPALPTQGLTYELNADGETAKLTGYGTATETEVVVAETYEGKPVTIIGHGAFENKKTVTAVRIPSSVKTIEEQAFRDCEALKTVEMPSALEEIGIQAFRGCTKLENFEIPSSLIHLGDGAFSYANAFTRTTYGNCRYIGNQTNPYLILERGNNTGSYEVHKDTKFIYDGAFDGQTLCTEIVIPEGVLSIGSTAFQGCKALKKVELPSTLQSIGSFLITSCSKLTTLNFNGTQAQWEAIDKTDATWHHRNSTWNDGGNVTSVICSDGTVAISKN